MIAEAVFPVSEAAKVQITSGYKGKLTKIMVATVKYMIVLPCLSFSSLIL